MTDSGLKREWNQIREASRLVYFHRRHLRPTGIMRYAERGMPLPALLQVSGELPPQMKQHYLRVAREGLKPQQFESMPAHKPIQAFNAGWNQSPTFLMGHPLGNW
jgi:hypothetical protein